MQDNLKFEDYLISPSPEGTGRLLAVWRLHAFSDEFLTDNFVLQSPHAVMITTSI